MNLTDVFRQLFVDIDILITKKIERINYDKTFKAKVIGIISSDKYKISYKNIEYPVKSEYQHNVGDTVWVCAPCNNWDGLYIQSVNQNDNTELINQITELNGEITNLKTQLTQTNSNLGGLIVIETAISGTTDSYGILTVNVPNQFTRTPYIITNISDALSERYTLTVPGRTSTTISIRVRGKSDNAAIVNTPISTRVLILGV